MSQLQITDSTTGFTVKARHGATMTIVCRKGHECTVPTQAFENSNYCVICSKTNKYYSGLKFEQDLKAKGWTLLSKYNGMQKRVDVKCPKEHEIDITPQSFINTGECRACKRIKRMTGHD